MSEVKRVSLSLKTKVEFGIVGGFIASFTMAVAIIILSALNVINFPYFQTLASFFAIDGAPYEISEYGLILFIVIEVIWGLIYAFAFKNYTVTNGVGMGAIKLFLGFIALTFTSLPEIGGNIFTITLQEALQILVSVAIIESIWGASIGYIGKKYLSFYT